MKQKNKLSRRRFLANSALASTGLILSRKAFAVETPAKNLDNKALISITLDLEMARNFPRWEDTHWDYEKGNLNDEAKRYAVEAARRVKKHGGVIHFFLVGRALEQENVDWLKEIAREGHPIGNHTYDHVYVLAKKPEEIQYRFARSPWLVDGKPVSEVIQENIRLCSTALRLRVGVEAAGFRTPGGFADGLSGRVDIQKMLLELGFKWASCKYPAHPYGEPGKEPSAEVFDGIIKAQQAAQPFCYPSGLIEIPMSPISDIGAFRNGRWKLEHFLKAIRLGVEWAIENRAVFDLLCHPSVLYPSDPDFKTIELVCELVKQAGDAAKIVDLDTIARRVQRASRK
jgi:hypothetical protein